MSRATEILRNQIDNYLMENPIVGEAEAYYNRVGEEFGVGKECIRHRVRKLNSKKLIETPDDFIKGSPISQLRENIRTGEGDYTFVTNKRIKTLEDLIEACDVDIKVWEIVSYEVNKWEVGRKDKSVDWNTKKGVVKKGTVHDSGKIFVEPLFQVKAKLSRRKVSKDLSLQKEAIMAEMRSYSPSIKMASKEKYNFENKETLLEISIFDPHFGKLGWGEETGEDYDLKIAEKRVKNAIKDLLSRVNLNNVQKILLPLGNDLINVDNNNNTTTAGTQQSTDVRFMKIIKVVRRILVEIIEELSLIAPVDVIIVPGNHDTSTAFMIGEILDATFYNNERVTVDNSPKVRKYYRYGSVGIQWSHGNEEPHQSLGIIFATEEPELWAATKFRFSQLGHFHKNKKINYVSVDEHQGFQVQIIPSLSGIDAWHYKKGYNTLHQAKSFLYHKTKGLIGEFTTTA